MKNKPFVSGIIATATPIPCFVFTILWCWTLCFGLGMGILGYDNIPTWLAIFSILPLLISPISVILGIIHSLVKIKQKKAWLGLLLSAVGFAENLGLIFMIAYLGRF